MSKASRLISVLVAGFIAILSLSNPATDHGSALAQEAVPTPLLSSLPSEPGPTRLPLDSIGKMLVDSKYGRVLISGGFRGSSIVAVDFEGNLVQTVGDMNGPTGMVLHRDRVFVLVNRDRTLDVLDRTSLRRIKRIKLPYKPTTQHYGNWATTALAKAGGKLWFNLRPCDKWTRDGAVRTFFTTFDLRTQDFHVGALNPRRFWANCPMGFLGGKPRANWLLAWDDSVNGDISTYEFDPRPDRARLRRQVTYYDHGGFADIAISADGSRIYTATGDPYEIEVFNRSTGRFEPSYPVGAYPTAVDISGDGELVAAGRWGPYDPDIYLFDEAEREPFFEHDFGRDDELLRTVAGAGVRLAPDASKLFALVWHDVVKNGYENEVDLYFHTIPVPERG